MRREDAVMISQEEMNRLYNIDEAIKYLMESYKNGENKYYVHNGETLYSCDGYTYDEYFLLAMGIPFKDREHLDGLVFGKDRSTEDSMKLSDLIMPVYSYLKEINKSYREELRNGKQKTI